MFEEEYYSHNEEAIEKYASKRKFRGTPGEQQSSATAAFFRHRHNRSPPWDQDW